MLATRIIFGDDVAITINGSSLQEVQARVYEALENGGWMVIQPENGPAKSINPLRILYMEELTPEEASQTMANGSALQAATAR